MARWLVVAVVIALASCASKGAVHPAAPSRPVRVQPACQPGGVALAAGRNGVLGLHDFEVYIVRNTGSRACSLDGYPAVTRVDGAGREVPIRVEQDVSSDEAAVVVPSGETA